MYIKEEILLIEEPIAYLRYYAVHGTLIQIYLYDNIKKEDVYQLTRVYSLHSSLFDDQFAFDEDKSLLYFSPTSISTYIRVVYYTEGKQSSFYIGGNLDQFLTKMLAWSESRIIDGLFVYWLAHEEGNPIKHIKAGSFVYQGSFYAYPGGTFDIREQAPPTIKETFRSYLLFINQEWLSNYVYQQNKMLNQIGIIHSTATDHDMQVTLNDVNAAYDNLYESAALKIAYIHIYLMSSFDYEVWVDYPKDGRSI